MKQILNVLKLSFRSFKEVFKFKKGIVLFSIIVLIISSVVTYFNIYLSKMTVDNLFNMEFKTFYLSLISLVSIKILEVYLTSLSLTKNLQLGFAFDNKCNEDMINIIEKTDQIHKDDPQFNADIAYIQFIKGKTFLLYNQFKDLCMKLASLLIGMHFLFNINFLFCVLAVSFGILKGLFNLRPVKKRVIITEQIQRTMIKHTYLIIF